MTLTNLVGMQFGRLTTVKELDPTIRPNGRRRRHLECLCVCGGVKISSIDNLKSGKINNCGCDSNQHGGTKTKLYGVWHRIRQSCLDKNHVSYKNYGGRGISFCAEWDEFTSFRDWALSSGYAEGLSIDRIDNNGNYTPENCRWATFKQQARNKRNNILIADGKDILIASDYAARKGIPLSTVLYRLKKSKVYHAVQKSVR
jgi:hypothetical protein